ncbi:MAG: adenylate/guanylate cyclase domain-containing protein [Gammaproteobacteria bacterium]|nr:adenylate/guanylate cyclase domain-containing protein [Gammaproteobacteria bacterium]
MMKKAIKSLGGSPFMLALLITLILLGFFHLVGEKSKILLMFELKALDLRFGMRGTKPPGDDVVIVAVDDTSIAHLGRWPWPRSVHAELLRALQADGAKAVGFDIIFSEAEENPEYYYLTQLQQYYASVPLSREEPHGIEFGKMLNQALEYIDNDQLFAQTIKNAGNVVLPMVFQRIEKTLRETGGQPAERFEEETPGEDEPPPELLEEMQGEDEPPPELLEETPVEEEPPAELLEELFVSSDAEFEDLLTPPQVKAAAFKHVIQAEEAEKFNMPTADTILLPLREYYENARALAPPNIVPDIDGNLRWSNMLMEYKDQVYQSFSLQLVKLFLDLDEDKVKLIQGAGIQAGKIFIPLDSEGRLLVNYYGPTGTFRYYTYVEVLEGSLPPGIFKDKIVLAGYAATSLGDIWTTPFSEAMPGIEKYATLIANILQEDFIHPQRSTHLIALAYILLTGIVLGLGMSRLSALTGAVFAMGILAAIFISNYWLFYYENLWVNLTNPVLAQLIISMSLTLFKFFGEEQDKRYLKATFSTYLAPEIIDEMHQKKLMPKLGGESRIITAFFSDLQGFSTISEKLTAMQLVELLNEYLAAMTDILLDEKGTLDKYEGDAIIAFIGAPMILPDHALRACRVAVSMQNKLLLLRERWRGEKQSSHEPCRNTKNFPSQQWREGDKWPVIVQEMKMRIGLNSGEAIVGNMGSSKRLNYTMMGDTVNLAARLEEAAKQYGVYTLISDNTLEMDFQDENGKKKKIMDEFETRFLDKITVVGKSEPTKVYELRALKRGLDDRTKRLFKAFGKGMEYYLRMEWDKAIAGFTESLELEDTDGAATTPSSVYIRRCEDFKENPPVAAGEEWNGVFRLTKK